jgi:DNA polymerase I-like protein with 3'-5' exonuclease and polymerase domains
MVTFHPISKTAALAMFALSIALSSTSSAALPVLSKDLEMKDIDDLQTIVMKYRNQNLHMEDKEEELRVNLFDAVRAAFARRNYDGAVTKVLNTLRTSLGDDEMDVMERVVEDSIEGVKNHSASVQEQKTHDIILHNFIREYQMRKKDFSGLLTKIKDAKIELSEKLKSENTLSNMTENDSPSKAAARALGEKNI